MKIAGLDMSLTSPGIVTAELDDKTLKIISLDWCGFTTVIKTYNKCKTNLNFYKQFPCYFDRTIWMKDKILSFLGDVDYVAFEDYAFASTGKSFHIGGFTEIIKLTMYEQNAAIRLYDITQIKKFATGKGNADKISMYDAFMKLDVDSRIDISDLPLVENTKGKSPTSDIIDAYYILVLLIVELKLRKGLINMQDLPEDAIWVFNRVTDNSDGNILSRDFIKKAK